ncbi:CUB and sushi domain-containing protein 3-like [Styela clava]
MLRSNVLFVLFMGFICSTAEENQHMCRKEGGFIYNRKCFWIIFDLTLKFTSAQAEEKCRVFNALPANIYDLQHLNHISSYGREKNPNSDSDYVAFLGMKYDPASKVLTNYHESISDLPESAWLQKPINRKFTEVGIRIANPPMFTGEGIGTGDLFLRLIGVICETDQLSCSSPQINMETQMRSYSDDHLTCTISCKPGFVLDDGSTSVILSCQDNLEWDGEVPTCQPVECPDLSFDGQPGLMHCNGNKYQDGCNFVCDSNKQLKGPRKRICNEDGTWSEIQPTCEDVICEPIDFPAEQGTFDCTDGNNYASYCSFYCKSGLQRWGAKKVVCL